MTMSGLDDDVKPPYLFLCVWGRKVPAMHYLSEFSMAGRVQTRLVFPLFRAVGGVQTCMVFFFRKTAYAPLTWALRWIFFLICIF